jgi:hypothetical protein
MYVVLAVAADAVLVAQHLPKLGAHLVTALARLHVHNRAKSSQVNTFPKAKIQAKDKRAKDRQKHAALR